MTERPAMGARVLALSLVASTIGLLTGVGAAQLASMRVDRLAADDLREVAKNLDACEQDPARWTAGPEPRVFAYDGDTFRAANAAAPPYLASKALAVSAVDVRTPSTPFGATTIAVRVREAGPCAVLQRHWPRRARDRIVATTSVATVALGFFVATMLASVLVVRPMLAAITRVAKAAHAVGDPRFEAPRGLGRGDLERIVEALAASHARILQSEALARDRVGTLERHLGEVAHDFRTPLTALQLCVEEVSDKTNDLALRAALATALQESVYLTALTENLRLVARHRELGCYGGLESSVIDLRDVVERVSCRAAILARRKEMTFSTSFVEGVVPVRCSSLAIERAISNIVENAVVHGSRQGAVRVSLTVSAERFELVVVEDGRAGGDSRAARVGSGLGLRITRGVCDEARWTLELEGDAARSRVSIRGPVAPEAET